MTFALPPLAGLGVLNRIPIFETAFESYLK